MNEFSPEDDVLRAALRALKYQREELAAVREGIDDMERGRLRPFEEVDSDLRREFGFPSEP